MQQTWVNRDLPVLRKIVEITDAGTGLKRPNAQDISNALAADGVMMDADEVGQALTVLQGAYVEVDRKGSPADWTTLGLQPRARQAAGQSPMAVRVATELADQLEARAQAESDPRRQFFLGAAATAFQGLTRDDCTDAVAQVMTTYGFPMDVQNRTAA